ncbi:MAG TPA: hypothetical protein VMG82_25995 [Candidatus Sulfotelmatobacter sp.]|nr:hypothetical protein [Candidatus Sulfotelmatobacter sp.]
MLEAAKIISATVGKDFFRPLVGHLASMLGGDCVYIVELVDSPVPKLRTIAVFLGGALGPSFEQEVSGCAGGQALSGVFAWSKDARRLFPTDPVLARFDAEGYVGALDRHWHRRDRWCSGEAASVVSPLSLLC